MIPVVTTPVGDLNYQVFNDNLTPVEQINRKMLCTIIYAQQHLVNSDFAVSKKIGEAAYTDAQLKTLNEKASALHDAVVAAITTFESDVASLDA